MELKRTVSRGMRIYCKYKDVIESCLSPSPCYTDAFSASLYVGVSIFLYHFHIRCLYQCLSPPPQHHARLSSPSTFPSYTTPFSCSLASCMNRSLSYSFMCCSSAECMRLCVHMSVCFTGDHRQSCLRLGGDEAARHRPPRLRASAAHQRLRRHCAGDVKGRRLSSI